MLPESDDYKYYNIIRYPCIILLLDDHRRYVRLIRTSRQCFLFPRAPKPWLRVWIPELGTIRVYIFLFISFISFIISLSNLLCIFTFTYVKSTAAGTALKYMATQSRLFHKVNNHHISIPLVHSHVFAIVALSTISCACVIPYVPLSRPTFPNISSSVPLSPYVPPISRGETENRRVIHTGQRCSISLTFPVSPIPPERDNLSKYEKDISLSLCLLLQNYKYLL